MLRTRASELFGTRYPVVQGGMVWASGWRLATAVARAGGLGLIGAGSMSPEVLDLHLERAAAALPGGTWGVNLPVFYAHADACLEVILRRGVRVVFTSGGSPRTYTGRLRAAGCVVAHVAATPEQAVKCEAAGVDAVVVEGFEAGGHDGPDELTTMALVPQAVDCCSIPVLAAGGVWDGRGMAAALALGASGVQVGTRFAATREASLHPEFKRAIVAAGPAATRLLLRRVGPVRVLLNGWARRLQEAEERGAPAAELRELLGRGRSRRGMFEGDLEEGELEIGQVAGAIRDLPPAGEVLERMVAQCAATVERLATLSR